MDWSIAGLPQGFRDIFLQKGVSKLEKEGFARSKDTLWGNLCFLLSVMKQNTPRTFRFLILDIPLKVLLPFIGIWMPNLVVRAVTEDGAVRQLLAAILLLGGVMVMFTALERYADGILEAEATVLQHVLHNMLLRKKISCDYANLEDKRISGRYEEADNYIFMQARFIAQAGRNLALFGSGIFGFLLYLSILRGLPLALLVLMAASTFVSLRFSNLGEKQRLKNRNYWGRGIRGLSYICGASSEAKLGKDIRLYHMAPWIEDRFTQMQRLFRREYMQMEKANFLSAVITAATGIAVELSAYFFLVVMVLDGRITVAQYVLYIGAVLGFSTWIRQVMEQMQKLWLLKGDVSCIREYLAMPDVEMPEGSVRQESGESSCSITFENVSYRYEGSEKDVLYDLSFHIEKGERVALVGMNGAGKTTCVKLLCGLLRPTRGKILINGVSAEKFSRTQYYNLFATVFQEINLFPASVSVNVTGVPKEEQDRERLEHALHMAGMDHWVASLPHGTDTLLVKEIDDQAVNLSGGEQQRLLLARALYKDAPILILDEPTAALDPISENNVYQKYDTLTKGNTSVFISHRLASTQFCDRILFMEDGRIVEEGTHETLLARGGKYSEVFETQSRYYRENPPDAKEAAFQ